LHYPAYADDARISHSHGWSSGPVLALSTFAGGLHVLNKTNWVVHPQPGNLTNVEAGFKIGHGSYAANYSVTANGARYTFSTPLGTKGSLIFDSPGCDGKVSIVGSTENGAEGHPSSGHFGHKKNFRWSKQIKDHGSSASPWRCGIWGPTPPSTHSSAGGTITIDDLAGGNYTVEVTCGS
jgi:hypothetical protein